MDTRTILSIDAAHGMQRKHSKLMRDLDRVRSMLPPELAARLLARVDVPGKNGKTVRAYRLPREALALLFMGEATKVTVTWAAGFLQKHCHD
ncbi:hypothetical protein [Desulfovibrio sp. SGI.169]|uniref:hypothetical protein n=1 Tax=Desulfovibrio sp. SGI.169 TaxID=3420561 RepID=UPI003D015AA8